MLFSNRYTVDLIGNTDLVFGDKYEECKSRLEFRDFENESACNYAYKWNLTICPLVISLGFGEAWT